MKRTFKAGQNVSIRTLTKADEEHYPELKVGDTGVVERVYTFHLLVTINGQSYGMEKFQMDIEGG